MMKRVLLVNPPESKQDGFFNPPLGLLYLAEVLREAGAHVAVADGCLDGWPAITEKIKNFEPHMVGVTCLTPERKAALRVARLAKEYHPQTLTVMGGAHPTIMDRQILENYAYVDVIARGEGEETIRDIAREVPLAEIAGISWRRGHEIVRNRLRPPIQDLDTIPFPAWDLVDLNRYPARGHGVVNAINLAEVPRISVIFSRGCVGQCHFCSTWWIWKGWRGRSAGNMADELSLLYHEFGIRHVCFADDTMTVNREEVIKLCQEIVTRGLKVALHLTTRTDCVDEEMLCWLREAGCYEIAYGIETASPRLLQSMGKEVEPATADKAVAMTKKAGIAATTLIIVGNVGETVETINETVNWLARAEPEQVGSVGGLWILPGTRLCARAKRLGLLDDTYWLTDEPYLVYTHEHDPRTLQLFSQAVRWRKKLVKPLWLNFPRFLLSRIPERLMTLAHRIKGLTKGSHSILAKAREKLRAQRRLISSPFRERLKGALSFVRDLPYSMYLSWVFPSRTWRRYYRHALNEYSSTTAWPEAQAQHIELLKNLPPSCSRVLDLGCGDGWSVNYIKQKLGKDAVGFTCNPQELRFARHHYPDVRIRFGDMHALPFRDGKFDAVYCREVYEHSIAPYIAMCEMNRVLCYHGHLLINIPDEQWLAYDSHFSVLTESQMTEMFRKCRFELLQKGRTPAGHYWYLARKTGQAPGL